MPAPLPISAIIATRHRARLCAQLLDSMQAQDEQLAEVIICDASDDDLTHAVASTHGLTVHYLEASQPGAAPQRNQAIKAATQPYVLLMDDDITLEPGCFAALWRVMSTQADTGGVTATIVNEAYSPPGPWTRRLLRWLEKGRERASYAGTCIGPGLTFWPADESGQPEVVPVEWMGAGCSLYRRDLLPQPAFPAIFNGASLCEDLALSLGVAHQAPLWQASRARFVHLNAGGDHKRSAFKMARMGLINRHYVMTHVMNKRSVRDYAQFTAVLLFGLAGSVRQNGIRQGAAILAGYIHGAWRLLTQRGPC